MENLSISNEVLALLVCPETKQALRPASPEELARWHAKEPFEGALVTADGSRAYPIRRGFPVVVVGEALAPEG